jgi:hypothetical protein
MTWYTFGLLVMMTLIGGARPATSQVTTEDQSGNTEMSPLDAAMDHSIPQSINVGDRLFAVTGYPDSFRPWTERRRAAVLAIWQP